jgi:hypothetical protein
VAVHPTRVVALGNAVIGEDGVHVDAVYDDEWQPRFLELLPRASLVLFRLEGSDSLTWELGQASKGPPERVVFHVGNDEGEPDSVAYQIAGVAVKVLSQHALPDCAAVLFIAFGANWEPKLVGGSLSDLKSLLPAATRPSTAR